MIAWELVIVDVVLGEADEIGIEPRPCVKLPDGITVFSIAFVELVTVC